MLKLALSRHDMLLPSVRAADTGQMYIDEDPDAVSIIYSLDSHSAFQTEGPGSCASAIMRNAPTLRKGSENTSSGRPV